MEIDVNVVVSVGLGVFAALMARDAVRVIVNRVAGGGVTASLDSKGVYVMGRSQRVHESSDQ